MKLNVIHCMIKTIKHCELWSEKLSETIKTMFQRFVLFLCRIVSRSTSSCYRVCRAIKTSFYQQEFLRFLLIRTVKVWASAIMFQEIQFVRFSDCCWKLLTRETENYEPKIRAIFSDRIDFFRDSKRCKLYVRCFIVGTLVFPEALSFCWSLCIQVEYEKE